MARVTVIAIRSFTHQGQAIHRGEAVTLEAIEAAQYAQAHRVTLDKDARATYRRRDLEAAPAAPPVLITVAVAPEPEPEVAAVPVTRRRRRSRRT
jgi:hypothetical protein